MANEKMIGIKQFDVIPKAPNSASWKNKTYDKNLPYSSENRNTASTIIEGYTYGERLQDIDIKNRPLYQLADNTLVNHIQTNELFKKIWNTEGVISGFDFIAINGMVLELTRGILWLDNTYYDFVNYVDKGQILNKTDNIQINFDGKSDGTWYIHFNTDGEFVLSDAAETTGGLITIGSAVVSGGGTSLGSYIDLREMLSITSDSTTPSWSALRDACIFWNTMEDITKSKIGPNGVETGSLTYSPGKFGNGVHITTETGSDYGVFSNVLPSANSFIYEYYWTPDFSWGDFANFPQQIMFGIIDGTGNFAFEYLNQGTPEANLYCYYNGYKGFYKFTDLNWVAGQTYHIVIKFNAFGEAGDKFILYVNDTEIPESSIINDDSWADLFIPGSIEIWAGWQNGGTIWNGTFENLKLYTEEYGTESGYDESILPLVVANINRRGFDVDDLKSYVDAQDAYLLDYVESGFDNLVIPETGAVPSIQILADQFDNPTNSDWAINSLAPVSLDEINNALTIRQFDDTDETGIGFTLTMPSSATNIIFDFVSRAVTSVSGSNDTVSMRLYYREIKTGESAGDWQEVLLTPWVFVDEYWNSFSETFTLEGLGLTAGKIYQFELTRLGAISGEDDNLIGNCNLLKVGINYT